MIPRLGEAALAALPASVEPPGYDRRGLEAGVVHLGIGGFHRAHQAVAFDDLLRSGDRRWGIRAASLRSPAVHDAMAPQDCLYTLAVRDGAAEALRLIGAVGEVIVAPRSPHALTEALAAAETRIVTLTVTEKGYKLDPATGALLAGDADLAADLAGLDAPRTAPGYLVAGLALRRARGLAPFTAISCDNLPHNGARLRSAVIALAERHDPALAAWIDAEGAFPATMVDRIVPATLDEDIAALAERTGFEDRAMVKTEPFFQWVIEDRFVGEPPRFVTRGIQLTADVAPWEEAKLRFLNGAHSAIAYLGGLAGIAFVHEFVGDAAARRYVEALWNEAETTLSPPPDLDIAAYRAALMARFANAALQHRTQQIAMDGSQKLPQRLLAPIAIRLKRGQSVDALALAVAAWIRWQGGRTDSGAQFEVDDPLAPALARLVRGRSPMEQVDAMLSFDPVFPPALRAYPGFRDRLVRDLVLLAEQGARAAVEQHAGAVGR